MIQGLPRSFRSLLLAVLLGVLAALTPLVDAHAQTTAPAPQAGAIDKAEIEAITRAVTEQVIKELEARGIAPKEETKPAEAPPETLRDEEAQLAHTFSTEGTEVMDSVSEAVGNFPSFASALFGIATQLINPQDGGRPFLAFLAILAGTLTAALAAAYAVRRVVRSLLPVTLPEGEPAPLLSLARLALADIAAYAALWFICQSVESNAFSGQSIQAVTAQWILWAVPRFALYYTVYEIFFRPTLAAARLVPLDDRRAREAMAFFGVIAFLIVVRLWTSIPLAAGVSRATLAPGLLVNNALFVGLFFWAAMRWREAIATWIRGGRAEGEVGGIVGWLARRWVAVAGLGVLALSLTHAYGAVTLRTEVTTGLTVTLRIVIALIFSAALIRFLTRRLNESGVVTETAPRHWRLAGMIGQLAQVTAVLVAIYFLAQLWIVTVLGLQTEDEWLNSVAYLSGPFIGIAGGYLALMAVRYVADTYLQSAAAQAVQPAKGSAAQGFTLAGSSRLRTLVPVLRLLAMSAVVLVTGLLVLSGLGINITPLLAGASVVGLAISFGSQSLVKDIVSGFFFLADDAFRVGEYIECGKAKGTVEGFTLRSIRLRHQDGQLHTVPFGQLGEITNYSRDWATVKFDVMLDREVDLEKVRKVAKKVGLSIQEDERFKDQILSPLKLQGITSVNDSSVTVRFKYNALPNAPVEMERLAKMQLLTALRGEGMLAPRYATMGTLASAAGVVLSRQGDAAPAATPVIPAAAKAETP